MNIIYMPSGQEIWIDIICSLKAEGFEPILWLGDPKHNEFAKSKFPNCEVLEFAKLHTAISLKNKSFTLDPSILLSASFMRLKDQVYKMMDRQDDLGLYNRLDREAFFYYQFALFHSKIIENNIDLLISAEGPHSPATMIMYGVCSILNIPTYHLATGALVPLVHIAKNLHGTKLKNINKLNGYEKTKLLSLVEDYIESFDNDIPTPLYIRMQNKSNRINLKQDFKRYITSPFYKSLKYSYSKSLINMDYTIYRSSFYRKNRPSPLFEVKKLHRKSLLKNSYDSIAVNPNTDEKYVFVPLHYEPERTTNPDGGLYYNVYDMILSLRSYIPNDVKIIIKEHSATFTKTLHGHRGKSALLYKSISTLPNIEIADVDTPSSILIRNSLFVATQTGTAALEASILGKKSLIFGTPWFLGTPNQYEFGSITYEQLLERAIYSKEDVKKYLINYFTEYTIPACINPSNYKYYSNRYPNLIDNLLNNKRSADEFAAIIKKDILIN